MLYAPGAEDDTALHAVYHKQATQGLSFQVQSAEPTSADFLPAMLLTQKASRAGRRGSVLCRARDASLGTSGRHSCVQWPAAARQAPCRPSSSRDAAVHQHRVVQMSELARFLEQQLGLPPDWPQKASGKVTG